MVWSSCIPCGDYDREPNRAIGSKKGIAVILAGHLIGTLILALVGVITYHAVLRWESIIGATIPAMLVSVGVYMVLLLLKKRFAPGEKEKYVSSRVD